MSDQISTAFVQQYSTNVGLLLQQRGSKLRDSVSVGSYTGKAAKAVEQIGSVTAQPRTSRHSDTPLISLLTMLVGFSQLTMSGLT